MAGSEIPTEFSGDRMNEIADIIKELPALPGEVFRPPHNSASLQAAQDIFGLMPKTHQKKCKLKDPMDLSLQLVLLARTCLMEERPGHEGRPIPQGKRTYEREAVKYDW
jgi:hypothetical protein